MEICGLGGIVWEEPLPPRNPDRDVQRYGQASFGNLAQYDVFLNHRGPDVKRTFVSQLDDALRRVYLDPFLDGKSLVKGRHAFHSIDEALSGVFVHVAVFSPRYAESKYCLNELCDMLKSHKPIIPVYYDVEPENLRWTEKGPFAEAFREHMKKGRNEDVVRWKAALLEVAAIVGLRLTDYDSDTKLVEKVVASVLNFLPTPLPRPAVRHPVGLEESSAHVINMLHEMGANVGVVGICGMGGIGKTTLAKEVYNQEQSRFGSRCFLNDVKEAKGGAVMDLQVKMVSDLLHVDPKKMHWNFSHWFEKIRKQKVLIVIDDISERKQLDELIPDLNELAPGSRVLVTSRESSTLKSIMLDVPQSKLYHVPKLDLSESVDLFVWCAFRKYTINDVDSSFHDSVKEIVRACDGLPLALAVLGRFLADKRNMPDDKKYWEDAISALRNNGEFTSKLRISYDGLANNEDKKMFRDIACYLQTKGQMSPTPLGGGFDSSTLHPNSGSAAFSAYPNEGYDFSVKSTPGDSSELDLYRSLQTKELDNQPNQDPTRLSSSTSTYPTLHFKPSTTAAGKPMRTPVVSTMEQDGSFESGSRGGLSSHEPISDSNARDPSNYMSISDFLLLLWIFLEPLSNIWTCLTDQGRLLIGSFILWFQIYIFERYIEQVPSRYKWRVNSTYLKTNRFLGQGCSGIIYETTWSGRENLGLLARKDFPAVERDVFEDEAARLVELGDHPNIVKSLCWTIDKRSCSLVMEYMRHDLYSVVQKRKGEQRKVDASANSVSPKHLVKGITPFELLTSIDLILQIATGMMYLHSRGIAHGDLKPSNVLVSSETSPILVQLVDFGLNNTKRRSTTLVSFRARCLQIVKWKAPELFEGYLDYLVVDMDNLRTGSHIESDIGQMLNDSNSVGMRKADIYSFALSCSHILGVQNWDPNLNWIELRKLILGGLRPQLPSGCPRILVSLISSCWDADPLRRPTFTEICKQLQVVNKRTFASW